ncbi:hypothetical protein PF672P2_00065 [Parabacteroides phage PF672P2]|nr:hypothetical protein PF672P1_00022 [Parabacteroides phage PF672P1]WAX17202.1 hypothetical protein PF672P2_00065 [Parabacteroides phage PF672P2]
MRKIFDFASIQANLRAVNEMLESEVCQLIPSELKPGNKVRFTTGNSELTGFLRYWKLDMNHYSGEIYIIFHLSKVKKNGTESKANNYFVSRNGKPFKIEIL